MDFNERFSEIFRSLRSPTVNLYCNNRIGNRRYCEKLIITDDKLAFYERNSQGHKFVYLIIKIEKRCDFNQTNAIIKEQYHSRSRNSCFTPNIIKCPKCDRKIGSELLIGPQHEPVISFIPNAIALIECNLGRFKYYFNRKKTLMDSMSSLSTIQVRTAANFYDKITELNLHNDKYYKIERIRQYFRFYDFNSQYALECFITQYLDIISTKVDSQFMSILNSCRDPKLVCHVLEKLTLKLKYKSNRNSDWKGVLKNIMNYSQFNNDIYEPLKLNKNLVSIRNAAITPNRQIFFFAEPNSSNRVTRQFNPDLFLRVRFRDDDDYKLNSMSASGYQNMDKVYENIEKFLKNGLNLCGRKYEFLAMSSSQLRDHSCWLFARDDINGLNAANVRQWMGNFKDIRCVGKYAARLGQSLSSSIETFESSNFEMAADKKVFDPIKGTEYCFTDGIGKISQEKALEICKVHYKNLDYCSAFQIRFGGFKGVVAVDPTLKSQQLVFRESMKKFESGHNKLDVLNRADYKPCYLNRQIIIILASLGISDGIFECLQDKMLAKLNKMLIDREIGSSYIRKYFSSSSFAEYSSHNKEFNYSSDAFFHDILQTIHSKHLSDLVKKSRIFVSKGRILIGTIDETDSLGPNEVYIQCSKCEDDADDDLAKYNIQSKTFVVKNVQIIVAKNPCMHPGDIRVLDAVDKPKLSHMIDCIVFPACGRRPIPNMCSGSDLDGDLYFVSWEKSLIPKLENLHEPMDYLSAQTKTKNDQVNINDIIKFFVEFIEVDQLGRLANAHIAISDSSPFGVKDPRCIELAKAFSSAVDFPKTGQAAKMPLSLVNSKLTYPDFMEKSADESYESNKAIGKMYRKAKSLLIQQNSGSSSSDIQIDKSFLVDDFMKFIDHARKRYLAYREEINELLIYYDCWQESELFSGINLMSTYFNDDAKEFFKTSADVVKKLWQKMREHFESDLEEIHQQCDSNMESIADKFKKRHELASAWYYVAYTSDLNKNLKVLSFPWVLEDILQQIYNQKDIFVNISKLKI